MSLSTFLTETVGIWRCRSVPSPPGAGEHLDLSELPPDTRRLIRNRRYGLILSRQNDEPFDEASLTNAWKSLEAEMAFVPAGMTTLVADTIVRSDDGFEVVSARGEPTAVPAFYLDRYCVTNADYAQFVQAGGYKNPCCWPEAILPSVLQFVDSTGRPGPKYWRNGTPPADKMDHPVVGVCWYEANAYAAWVGKRLPTSRQWQRAGTWAHSHRDHAESRYPWGNSFDPSKANLRSSRLGTTAAVHAYTSGSTPNGVCQLIGNVWQWIDALFEPRADNGLAVLLDDTMAEIRGGAFDTYFQSQATCQFRTGQPVFFRGANVGFRCCLNQDDLQPEATARTLEPST